MLVRLSYDRRVALFPSLAASWPISFLGGREKQARVADRRASYAIFSTYVDEETNFYLKKTHAVRRSARRVASFYPRKSLRGSTCSRSSSFASRGCSFNLFQPAESGHASVLSFASKSMVQASSGSFDGWLVSRSRNTRRRPRYAEV